MVAQENLYKLVARTPGATEFFSKPYVMPFVWLFGRIMINTSMAFAFLTFGLIKKEVWIRVSFQINFTSLFILAGSRTLLLGIYCIFCCLPHTQSSLDPSVATKSNEKRG
jgi:hypothetical protein